MNTCWSELSPLPAVESGLIQHLSILKTVVTACKWHQTSKIITFYVCVSTVPTSVISLPLFPPPNISPPSPNHPQPTQEATAKLVGTRGDSPAGGGVEREGGVGGFSTKCPWVIEIINSAANDSSPWHWKTLSASLGARHRRWGRFPTHFSRGRWNTEHSPNMSQALGKKRRTFVSPPQREFWGCCANPTATKWPQMTLKHELGLRIWHNM